MKCPRCGLEVSDAVPRCEGCGFTMADLDALAGALPARDGLVIDLAGKLTAEERSSLVDTLGRAGEAVHGELVVAIVNKIPVNPAAYAFWLFNRWGIGGDTHAGLLVLIALYDHRVECEVGYSWEGVLDEEQTGAILDEHVVPGLIEGKFAEALRAGIEQAAAHLQAAMGAAA